ncbi:Methyltransferase type 11, partial [gut metagenome]
AGESGSLMTTVRESASKWVRRWQGLVHQGPVLDMTCGHGRNTALFILAGFPVLACGEDVRALEPLVGNALLTLECRDLENEEWPWPAAAFSAVLITEAVSRALLEKAWDSLCPEGVLIVEMPTAADQLLNGRTSDCRAPEEGELLKALPTDARLVAYEEGADENERIRVRLVAVKRGNPTPYAYLVR